MRKRSLVALALAVVVAGAAFAFLRHRTEPDDEVAGVVPPDAAAYVNVFLNPSTAQKRALRGFLDAFPRADTDDEAAQVIAALADGALGGLGLSYEWDVAPWVGDQMGGFVLPAGPHESRAAALVIAAEDEERARRAVGVALAHRRAPVVRRSYRGHGYRVAGGAAAGVVEGFVVVGQEEAVRASISASEGGSLAAEADFRSSVAGLHGSRLAVAYLSGSALGQVTGASPLELLGRRPAGVVVFARHGALVAEAASPGGVGLPAMVLALLLRGGGGAASAEPARRFLDDGYEAAAYVEGPQLEELGSRIVPAVPEVRAFTDRLSYVAVGTKEVGDRFFVEFVLGAG
jgi:hypothetical protein